MAPRKTAKKNELAKRSKGDLTVTKGKMVPAEAPKAVKAAEKSVPAKEEVISSQKSNDKAVTDKKAGKKTTTARGGSKKASGEKKISHFFEIDGLQVNTDDITQRIQEAYKAEGHQIGRIKKIEAYYNFEEHRAYYVINDNAEGKFVEF